MNIRELYKEDYHAVKEIYQQGIDTRNAIFSKQLKAGKSGIIQC